MYGDWRKMAFEQHIRAGKERKAAESPAHVIFPCKYVMGPPITAASVQALTEVSAVRQG